MISNAWTQQKCSVSIRLHQQLSIFFTCCCAASCGSILLWFAHSIRAAEADAGKEYHDHLLLPDKVWLNFAVFAHSIRAAVADLGKGVP